MMVGISIMILALCMYLKENERIDQYMVINKSCLDRVTLF